jgi:hypothetical protein
MIMDPAAAELLVEVPAVESLLLTESQDPHPDGLGDQHTDQHTGKGTWIDLDPRLAPALAQA